jgi:hypothetical protein
MSETVVVKPAVANWIKQRCSSCVPTGASPLWSKADIAATDRVGPRYAMSRRGARVQLQPAWVRSGGLTEEARDLFDDVLSYRHRMEKPMEIHIRRIGRLSVRRCVMRSASARSSSDPLANSTPRASSCRTKASNWSEAKASRKVNCSDCKIIITFLVGLRECYPPNLEKMRLRC